MDHEFEHMRKDIELALDQVLAPARHKSMVKQIVTSSMKQVVEIPLNESGQEYNARYNNKSAVVRVKIGGNRWLEANLKYGIILESVDRLIAAALAMKELYLMTGNNIGLPVM